MWTLAYRGPELTGDPKYGRPRLTGDPSSWGPELMGDPGLRGTWAYGGPGLTGDTTNGAYTGPSWCNVLFGDVSKKSVVQPQTNYGTNPGNAIPCPLKNF